MMRREIAYDAAVQSVYEALAPIVIQSFDEAAGTAFEQAVQKYLDADVHYIPVVIDSYGGTVYSAMGMIETIRTAQDAGHTVVTYCASKAMSCGSVLFSCGTRGYRFVAPLATLLVHQIRGGASGKNEDIQTTAECYAHLNELFLGIISENCGKPRDYWMNRLHHNGNADIFLTAQQALDVGLADEKRAPAFRISVTQTSEIL
jgi:ATP-dependent Clp protease protease subunit